MNCRFWPPWVEFSQQFFFLCRHSKNFFFFFLRLSSKAGYADAIHDGDQRWRKLILVERMNEWVLGSFRDPPSIPWHGVQEFPLLSNNLALEEKWELCA